MASAKLLGSLSAAVLQDITDGVIVPLGGRRIWVYKRDTTTAVTVYADEALTEPLTQPLMSDSTGTLPGYVAGSVSVDFVDVTTGDRNQAEPVVTGDVIGTDGRIGGTGALPLALVGLTDPDLNTFSVSNPSGTSAVKVYKKPDYVYFEDGGAIGDGTTDDSAAIVAAFSKAVSQGRSLRATAGKTYAIANRIDLSTALAGVASPPAIILTGATIKQNAATYLFYASATANESTKTAMTHAINAGDPTITLPTGGGAAFSVGSYIAVQCLNAVFGLPGTGGSGNLGYAREIKQVIAISGDVLTVDSPYIFAYPITATAYSVGNSSYYSKINPLVAPEMIGGTFTNPNLSGLIAGTSNGYLARWEQCKNVRMRDITAAQMGGGILCLECIGIKIDGDFSYLQYQDGSGFYGAPWGYGVALDGCCRDAEIDVTGRAVRHLYTSLGNNFSGANVPGSGGGTDPNSPDGQWYIGGPMFPKVRGVGNGDPLCAAVFDTHPYGYGHDFDVTAIGGAAGLQDRAVMTTGRVAARQQTGNAGVVQQTTTVNSTLDVDVSGVTATASKAVSMAGANCTIRGRVHDNLLVGVAVASTATNPVIEADIINNTSYGIQDLGSTGLVITRCRIPKSATQTVSILNIPATAKVLHCDLTGYGGNSAGLVSPNNGFVMIGCLTDTGLISNGTQYLSSSNANLSFDVDLFRAGTALLRTDASFLTTKLFRTSQTLTITGKTSAQIDTEVNAITTAADGMIIFDDVNFVGAVRLGGNWYPITLGTHL